MNKDLMVAITQRITELESIKLFDRGHKDNEELIRLRAEITRLEKERWPDELPEITPKVGAAQNE